ncbi:MAG: hypothetical protein OEZ40_01590 [Candidatus Bathyarchaeota archaeon]|nr:hypothetical protein [Candidatus Bathyarchaeota archaeon]
MPTPKIDACFKYIFMWHSLSDACPKCTSLNGREWTEQSIFQETLWDVFYGDIWNLDAGHSLAHGKAQYNCRCQLTVRVEVDITKLEEYKALREQLRVSL